MEGLIYSLMSIVLPLLLRAGTGLYSYSGETKPPMYGDYEAQRHWMEITTNLPMYQWYVNSTQNDLQYWGLDYPPLTAYHSWILGEVAKEINPAWVALNTSRGFESPGHKLFMRYSVIATDVILYFSGVIAFCLSCFPGKSTQYKMLTAGVMLSYPGLILIDHGHFQYNSVSLGLLVWAVALLAMEYDLLGAVAFSLALNYKQMELYHALPFFCYLLSNCFNGKQNWFVKLASVGCAVVATFSAVWLPFLMEPEDALHVLQRVFPFARGLYEDKVASFWCSISVLIKIKEVFTQPQIVRMCLITTLAGLLPSSVGLLLEPTVRNFKLALINSSLVFFLFSFHVHEKSILLAAIPVCLMIPEKPLSSLWFLTISTFSMLPLLVKDGLVGAHIALSGLFFLLCILGWEYLYTASTEPHAATLASIADIRRDKERREREGLLSALALALFWLSLGGAALLTAVTLLVPPPSHLPDLWPVLVSIYSCGHFLLFLFYYHWQQLMVDEHGPAHTPHHHHGHGGAAVVDHQKGKSRTLHAKHHHRNKKIQ